MFLIIVRTVFLLTAIFNFVLAIAYGLFYKAIYHWADVELPNHPVYMQLPAVFIFLFGIGMLFVVYDPLGNRPIMLLGALMKTGYATVILGNFFFNTMPVMYVVYASCDLTHAVFFLAAYLATKPPLLAAQGAENGSPAKSSAPEESCSRDLMPAGRR